MSNEPIAYPLDHRVFSGGRYLRAFDHLHDIDHFEHSILTYLGSLMPFDKGFVDHPAFPSVATIARSTKISESTVRKKIKELKTKGYVKVKAVRLMNLQGHFQQSSNNYFISNQAFSFFDDVLASNHQIQQFRKRAVGDSVMDNVIPRPKAVGDPFSQRHQNPSPVPLPVGSYSSASHPACETMPNSPSKTPKENPPEPDSFSTDRDIFTMKSEVDRIVKAWEEIVRKPVSKGEKDSFLREFIRMRYQELFFMERLLKLMNDPYLMSRAQSLNFLFNGFDAAEKNGRDIKQIAKRALERAETPSQLDSVLEQLPDLIAAKSHNYANPTPQLIQQLLQEPIKNACNRLHVKEPLHKPGNATELNALIEKQLRSDIPDSGKERLKIIQMALSRSSFAKCMDLYEKYSHPSSPGQRPSGIP